MSQKEGGDFADFQAKSPIVSYLNIKIYKFSDQILMLLTEDWIPFLVEKKQGGGDTYL